MDRTFLWRRIHSLLGLWIVIFLLEHLFTNSQAALLPEENWSHFIRAVNFLRELPYIHAIEIGLLGIPILFHAGLGVRYLMQSQGNALLSNGTRPSLPRYGRNHAYSWQRYTSWILLMGLILHVGYMRFLRYPDEVVVNGKTEYVIDVEHARGMEKLGKQLGVTLFEREGKLMAKAPTAGMATLLVVRDAFYSPFKCILYTIFVLAACFHAFNGLWTFLITWGAIIRIRSQRRMVNVCVAIMLLMIFLGLAAVWGTHWSFYR